MNRKFFSILGAVAAFVLLTAFGPGAPIYNVKDSPIPANQAATMENIQKANAKMFTDIARMSGPGGPWVLGAGMITNMGLEGVKQGWEFWGGAFHFNGGGSDAQR